MTLYMYMYMCILLNHVCLFVWDIPRLCVAVLDMECDYRLYMVDILSFTSSSVCYKMYILPYQVLPASGRDAFLQSNHPFASILVCVILQVG